MKGNITGQNICDSGVENRFVFVLIIIAVWAITHLACLQARADETGFPEAQFEFEGEKRFIICTGTGYACVSKKRSPEKARQRALAVAKRLVLRKTSQILRTRVEDIGDGIRFELAEIRQGEYVRVLEQKEVESPIQGPDTAFGIQITAQTEYRLITSYDNRKLLSDSRLPLTVRVWTSKQVYREGEKILFYVRGSSDFFTCVVDISPDGDKIQLLPNLNRKSASFKGGKTYNFPEEELYVYPPFGKETVLVFASNAPLGEIPFDEYISQFGHVKGSETDIRSQVVPKPGVKPGVFSYVEFFESRWLVRTKKMD